MSSAQGSGSNGHPMATRTHRHTHHSRPHRHHYDEEMLSVEEARERILSHFSRLDAVDTPLLESRGRVLDEDLTAPFDIPPLANSAMDGYAVRSTDVASASDSQPVLLPVAGAVAAGELPDRPVPPGGAIRIMTGAPIPDNADAVVPFEDTDESERRRDGRVLDQISVRTGALAGDNVRPAGEDIEAGELVLKRGTVMRAAEIGVAASLGRDSVLTTRRPSVAIISTGDELISPGSPPEPGKIYNSNAFSIAAMVERYGGIPRIMGIAKDTIEALSEVLDASIDSDMVVTSAGVSKGDYDVVKGCPGATRRNNAVVGPDEARQAPGLRNTGRTERPQSAPSRPARQPGQCHGRIRTVRPTGPTRHARHPVVAQTDRRGSNGRPCPQPRRPPRLRPRGGLQNR